MRSTSFRVIDGSIYVNPPNNPSRQREDILDEYEVVHCHRYGEDRLVMKSSNKVREFMESNRYPYCVYTGRKNDDVSRYWTPSSEPELITISGLDNRKCEILRSQGMITLDDVKSARQKDLFNIDGIGRALAARIKADTGDYQSSS